MTQKMMALVAFSGDFPDLDVDAAAKELEQAGFEVHRLPDKYAAMIRACEDNHPADNFLEAHLCFDASKDVDEIMDRVHGEVNVIANKYGGLCYQWGRMKPGHVPFVDLFEGWRGVSIYACRTIQLWTRVDP